MKNGIILAGGTGSRLYPLTHVVNKHLLGVNGKFVIDYPIETLKGMGCTDVTVILGGAHFSQVVGYLQDGARYGLNINYVYQGEPKGIAHAISLCQKQMSDDDQFAVILGDNIYENPVQWDRTPNRKVAQVVLHKHPELNRFGVATIDPFDCTAPILKIQEKPKSLDQTGCFDHYAITGCYLFTSDYFDRFKTIVPSARGEYEITDIINSYNDDKLLSWTKVSGLWSDAGTHESIAHVNNYFFNKQR